MTRAQLEAELADALRRKEFLRDEFAKNEGAISFITYALEKEKDEGVKE